MKKLLLSGILALAAAASFAQNSVTIAQTGTANSSTAVQNGSSLTATISQVGPTATDVTNNTAITDQSGTGHSATINQNGTLPNGSTFNRAYATQRNGSSVTGANSVTISQSNGSGGAAARGGARSIVTGDLGNFAGTFQTGGGNQAVVMQDGPGSKANLGEISQRGTGNTATTTQSNGAVSNLAQTFQGYNLADVSSNTATISQDQGQRNEALVNQFSNGNTAIVVQAGITSTDNKAYVQQGALDAVAAVPGSNTATILQAINSSGNSATAVQTGTNGTASIGQLFDSQNNQAIIRQIEGTNGYAEISQGYTASGNKATVTQYGSTGIQAQIFQLFDATNNTATINQGDAGNSSSNNVTFIGQGFGATSNTATVGQNRGAVTGSNNGISIEQIDATNNIATILQNGSNNKAGLKQSNPGSVVGNVASFTQTGDNNLITGSAIPLGGAIPTGVTGEASQNGSGNSMLVNQISPVGGAFGNSATLNQTGDGNILTVTQTIGIGAMAGNIAVANQTGMNNQAIVQQTAMP